MGLSHSWIKVNCLLDKLKDQWYGAIPGPADVPGLFVKQGIPIDQTVFTTNIRPSIDNLYSAETTILLEEIPLPDGIVLGNLERLQAITVDLFGIEAGENFEDREDEIHSSIEVGDPKECE